MMNIFTRFTLVLCVLFLFGGKARANDSDAVNCNHVWKLAILGSSTSYGTGASTYDSSWAGKFIAYIKRKNSQNLVYNFGIPGFTTYQNLCATGFVPPANRPSPDNSFNITAALAAHVDAIIINMPTNDAFNNYTLAEQQANYERTMHLADSAHVPVWVTTTQPRNNLTAAQVSNLTAMRDWILTRFGDKAVDFWTTVANGDGSINSYYDYDYAHVNNSGHDLFYKRMIAESILDSLCNRTIQTLVAKAGNDVSVVLPSTTTVLNGTASYSSNGGTITSYHWLKISGAANASIVSPSASTTNITNLAEGRYSFSLTVTDNALSTKTDTVNVIVSSRIMIDFGPDLTTSPDPSGKYWNNITETQPGVKLSNAVTVANIATTIGLQVVNRIDGTFNVAGPGTNNGNTLGALNDYPATSTSDFSFADPSATNGSWKIMGLESTKQYTIKFWGTKTIADDRIIQIKRADQSTWQEYNATNNNNYNTAAIFTFSGKTEMSFDIRVKAGSAFGYISLIDITRTTPAVALNVAPVARANDVTVALPGTSGVLDGSTSGDDDGSIISYQWQQTAGPSNAQIVSPSSAVTTVNNLSEGIYTFLLTVKDDSNAVATHSVILTVSSRVLFDFGPDLTTGPDANGKYWNNITDGLPDIKIQNAVTTGNTATSLNLEITNRIDGTFNVSGPGTNTGNTVGIVGDYPASTTTDFAFAHPSATNGSWKISGLIASKQYTVKFWGARTVADERFIQIKRSDETSWQEYDAQNNIDYNNAAVFTFSGKTEMNFDIKVKDGDAFGYISLMDIKITNASQNCAPSISITSGQVGAGCSGSSVTFNSTITNGGTIPAYQWKRNGTDISGATGSSYTTTTLINNDIISCVLTANTSCSSGTTAISNNITASVLPIVGQAGNISGPTDVCPFIGTATNAVYSISPLANATTYTWVVPTGAIIISGQGTVSITVSYTSSFGNIDTISVVGGVCTNSPPSKLAVIKIVPDIPASIAGPTDACPFMGQATNAVYSVAAVANAISYTWTAPAGASVVSGQGTTSVNISYSSSFSSGSVTVTANANCGSRSPRSLSISKLIPAAPVSISGPVNACAYIGTNTQATYSIATVANAISYTWTLPANVNLISGQGTTSIIVTFAAGYTTSNIKVKSNSNCASSADRTLSVTTTTGTKPGVISGPTNACAYIGSTDLATYSIRKVANALSYIWTMPAGAAIVSHPGNTGVNDTIITVSFNNNFVSGTTISVQSSGCVASTARTLTITRSGAPATPGNITGPTNSCPYVGTANPATYTISTVAAASSYTWTLPAGATAMHPAGSGSNDTIITVTYSSGYTSGTISVLSSNACGSTNVTRNLTVKSLVPNSTPTITGPTDPCVWIGTAGATYKINKIANATSYTWTVPATGATATHPNGAGINDTIIIVNYTPSFTTGNITARADANCGSSSVRTLAIVRKLPSTPGNITTTVLSACPNRQYSYSIAAMPVNATSVTWSVPAGAIITNGQGTTNITVNYPQTAVSSSITAVGTNNCANSASPRTLTINLPACSLPRQENITGRNANGNKDASITESGLNELEIKVMPNPSYRDFKLLVSANDKKTPASLRLSNASGKIVEIKTGIKPGQIISVGSNYARGIYMGEIVQGSRRRIIKLIKL